MSNPFYNPSSTPASGSPGASAPIRAEFAAISAGFTALSIGPRTFTPTAGQSWNINGTYGGPVSVSAGGSYTLAGINLWETNTLLDAATIITSLNVQHYFSGGEGARSAINAFLSNSGPTAHTGDHAFYAAISSATYIASSDGGTLGNEKGDFFGATGIVTATAAASNLHGVIGAEYDVSVVAGASVLQKVGLQVATVNNDAVQGGLGSAGGADMAISILGDVSTTANWRVGLCFGRAGSRFNVSGTLIGWEPYSVNTPAPTKAIDFSGLTFSGDMVDLGGTAGTPFFQIAANGSVTINGDASNGKSLTTKCGFPSWVLNDLGASVTTGGLVRLTGLGSGVYQYQINTASAGNFTSAIAAWQADADGLVEFAIGVKPAAIEVGAPTGGLPGAGSVNIASTYLINNVVAITPISGGFQLGAAASHFGIGTASAPVGSFEVAALGGSTPRGITTSQYSADNKAANLNIYKSRAAAPGSNAAVLTSDNLGIIRFCGDAGSGFSVASAGIQSQAEEDFTGLAAGANLIFFTAPTGSTSTVERMVITAGGNVGIKNNTPTYQLDVGGDINTSAVYRVAGTQVVGARDTGWAAMTGSPDKGSTYATSTVSLVQLAGRVAELQAVMTAHGLVGP